MLYYLLHLFILVATLFYLTATIKILINLAPHLLWEYVEEEGEGDEEWNS